MHPSDTRYASIVGKRVLLPLAAPGWLDPTRAGTVSAPTAPGEVGSFAFDLSGRVPRVLARSRSASLGFLAEKDHDYLWRCMKCLPERGRIGIFNRSHYEDVLIARVHPAVLAAQKLLRDPFEEAASQRHMLRRTTSFVARGSSHPT